MRVSIFNSCKYNVTILYCLLLFSLTERFCALQTPTTIRIAKQRRHTQTQVLYSQAKNEQNVTGRKTDGQQTLFATQTISLTSTSPRTSRTNQLMMAESKKNKEIALQWESEIQATTKDKLDRKKVSKWLEPQPESEATAKAAKRTVAQWNEGWRVALAAGTVIGLGCESVTHSPVLALATFCFVFFTALRDPATEINEDNVAGPLARIIGRTAIQSYEVTQPKIKAVARAALRGDEDLAELKIEVEQLRKENAQLRLYVERRQWIDDHQSDFGLEDLKNLAQRFSIAYSGVPKPLLMMRLLEAGALRMR